MAGSRVTAFVGAVALLVSLICPRALAADVPNGNFVSIVAHEDDDLLFLNPDVVSGIRRGNATTTIFLTAGEATVGQTVSGDPYTYAANREAGSQAAYATMAQVSNSWQEQKLVVGGIPIQQFTLTGRPDIHLIFLQLPDGGDPRSNLGLETLRTLWFDRSGKCANTFVRAGSPYAHCYTRAQLIATLGSLLIMAGATILRAQSVIPDERLEGDHTDHIRTSQFASEAGRNYTSAGHVLFANYYHDYNIDFFPVNVSPDITAIKAAAFKAYVAHDFRIQYDWYLDRFQREYRRFPRHTTWVVPNKDGGLEAFVMRGYTVDTWRESPGGTWQGPVSIGNASQLLIPSLGITQNADGRLQVFGIGVENQVVVTAAQQTPGGAFGPWYSLGRPPPGQVQGQPLVIPDPSEPGALLASPTPVLDSTGRINLFIKNDEGTVSTISQGQPNGCCWRNWQNFYDFSTNDVQDGLASVPSGSTIDLYAWTLAKTQHLAQTTPGGAFEIDGSFLSRVPVTGPAAVLGRDGKPFVVYRMADKAIVVSSTASCCAPLALRTPAGWGDPAIVEAPWGGPGQTRAVVFSLDNDGNVGMNVQNDMGAGFGDWISLGGQAMDSPAAAVDALGLLMVFIVGPDGRLYARKQQTQGSTNFGPWALIGS